MVIVKRESEERCRAAFHDFLRQRYSGDEIDWEEVPESEEPPDYFLCLSGTRYAVEVTGLMAKLSVGGHDKSTQAIVQSLRRFGRDVESSANDQGYLRGTYFLHFSRQVREFGGVEDQVKDDLLRYIRNTQNQPSCPKEDISTSGRKICEIQKMAESANEMLVTGPMIARFEGEVDDELVSLLRDRVNAKVKALRKIDEPKILLLDDEYGLALWRQYPKAWKHIESAADSFVGVFLVMDGRARVLCCRDAKLG